MTLRLTWAGRVGISVLGMRRSHEKRILTILGHPTHARQSFCEALTLAYQAGAPIAGHDVQLVTIARLKTSIPAGPSVRQRTEA